MDHFLIVVLYNDYCYNFCHIHILLFEGSHKQVDMAQKAVTIGHTAFPLYTIRMLGDRHFLVAGGGGSAKTGIANAIVSSDYM